MQIKRGDVPTDDAGHVVVWPRRSPPSTAFMPRPTVRGIAPLAAGAALRSRSVLASWKGESGPHGPPSRAHVSGARTGRLHAPAACPLPRTATIATPDSTLLTGRAARIAVLARIGCLAHA